MAAPSGAAACAADASTLAATVRRKGANTLDPVMASSLRGLAAFLAQLLGHGSMTGRTGLAECYSGREGCYPRRRNNETQHRGRARPLCGSPIGRNGDGADASRGTEDLGP